MIAAVVEPLTHGFVPTPVAAVFLFAAAAVLDPRPLGWVPAAGGLGLLIAMQWLRDTLDPIELRDLFEFAIVSTAYVVVIALTAFFVALWGFHVTTQVPRAYGAATAGIVAVMLAGLIEASPRERARRAVANVPIAGKLAADSDELVIGAQHVARIRHSDVRCTLWVKPLGAEPNKYDDGGPSYAPPRDYCGAATVRVDAKKGAVIVQTAAHTLFFSDRSVLGRGQPFFAPDY